MKKPAKYKYKISRKEADRLFHTVRRRDTERGDYSIFAEDPSDLDYSDRVMGRAPLSWRDTVTFYTTNANINNIPKK